MGEKQGWVIIGTKLDNKQLAKDLKQQRKMLEDNEKEAEELIKSRAEKENSVEYFKKRIKDAEKFEKEYKKINEEYDETYKKIKEIYDTPYESEMEKRLAENPGIMDQYKQLGKKVSEMSEQKVAEGMNSKKLNEYLEEEEKSLEDINNRLGENLSKQELIKSNINQINASMQRNQINKSLQDIGKSLTSTVKKVARWGLAIFGVRGAYMAVRNAINVISQEDKQLKADIDYMKTAFAYTLEPIVRKIVELAKEFMYAIQYIAYVLTGKNIFANANKGLDNANKKAQALSKTIAGFDEMNVVSGGGSADNGTPSFNLSEMHELSNTGKGIVGIIGAITGAITAMKLSELLKTIGAINSALTVTQGLGIFMIILSVYNIVKDLIDIWNKFDETTNSRNWLINWCLACCTSWCHNCHSCINN